MSYTATNVMHWHARSPFTSLTALVGIISFFRQTRRDLFGSQPASQTDRPTANLSLGNLKSTISAEMTEPVYTYFVQ